MWRYFTYKQTYKYVDVLQDLMNSYNNSYHRTIKTTPANVNKNNEKKIWKIMYGDYIHNNEINFKYKEGDLVRISKSKNIFEKGYTANWTRELFKIYKCLPRSPPV